MSKENLQFAVSSMSTGEYRPSHLHEILVPRFATEQLVKRTAYLKERLGPVFGQENISLSLHPATTIDMPKAIKLLQAAGIPVSSIDAPSVYANKLYVSNVLKSFLGGNLRELKIQTGWRLQNVESEEKKEEKLDEALKAFSPATNPKIFRSNAEIWHESREGEELRRKLKGQSGAIIAIELDAKTQTPAEYLRFLKELAKTNDKDTPVYADIDLGHLEESKYLHDENQISEPLDIYEKILRDPETSRLVAVTSLNQYKAGETHTHTNFMHGPIDFSKATKELGIAAREGRLPFPPMTIAEFFPMEYEQVLNDSAIKQWKTVKEAFDNGR